MEKSLRALLEQRQLAETERRVISLDVVRAVNYLHKPIIHRDVSSANVLLWQQGHQWRGKVSDYGTANFMQQTMTVAPGTSNHTVTVSFSTGRIFLFSGFSSTSSDFKETRWCSHLEHVATLKPGCSFTTREKHYSTLPFFTWAYN